MTRQCADAQLLRKNFPSWLAPWLNASVKVSVNDVIRQAWTCLSFERRYSPPFSKGFSHKGSGNFAEKICAHPLESGQAWTCYEICIIPYVNT